MASEPLVQTAQRSPPAQPTRAKRSQFIDKLHDLLEHPFDPDSLRWTPDGEGFEITTNEPRARNALSPKWDFRSLSSFIRQLSYYNFKRLSDRRRSSERRGSGATFIVFSHPTGYFVRGDNSRLDGIIRKTRTRQTDKNRRDSLVSAASTDDTATLPFPQYDEGQPGPSYSNLPASPFGYAASAQGSRVLPPASLPLDSTATWRSYPQLDVHSAPATVPTFSQPPNPQPSPIAQHDYSHWQQQNYRSSSLTQSRASGSPRSESVELSSGRGYQVALRTHSPLALNDPTTLAGGAGEYHAPYSSPAYANDRSNAVPGTHGYGPTGGQSSRVLPAEGAVPSGLPMLSYDPLGHRPSWPSASLSSYSAAPALHGSASSSLQSYHLHPQGPGPSHTAPSPTYSPDDDSLPPHVHVLPNRIYEGSSAPHHASAQYHQREGLHQQPWWHQQQQPFSAAATNGFPNLTHLHPPPDPLHVTQGYSSAHSASYGHHHQPTHPYADEGRRGSIQLPPFGSGAAASPDLRSGVANVAGDKGRLRTGSERPGDQAGTARSHAPGATSGGPKLGWASPAPPSATGRTSQQAQLAAICQAATAPTAAIAPIAAAGVFGQWAGFGAPPRSSRGDEAVEAHHPEERDRTT